MLAMLLYSRGRGYGLSLECFGLALLSKEMAVTLPVWTATIIFGSI
jgi:hypothetical protein